MTGALNMNAANVTFTTGKGPLSVGELKMSGNSVAIRSAAGTQIQGGNGSPLFSLGGTSADFIYSDKVFYMYASSGISAQNDIVMNDSNNLDFRTGGYSVVFPNIALTNTGLTSTVAEKDIAISASRNISLSAGSPSGSMTLTSPTTTNIGGNGNINISCGEGITLAATSGISLEGDGDISMVSASGSCSMESPNSITLTSLNSGIVIDAPSGLSIVNNNGYVQLTSSGNDVWNIGVRDDGTIFTWQ
jgi:hypothetical protein